MWDGALWRKVHIFRLYNTQSPILTHPNPCLGTCSAENKGNSGPPTAPVEPLNTLEQAFSPYTTDRTMLEQLASYFEPVTVPEGYVLWKQDEPADRSEEHTSELQTLAYLVCRLLLEKK